MFKSVIGIFIPKVQLNLQKRKKRALLILPNSSSYWKIKINNFKIFRILFLESDLRKSKAFYFIIVVLIKIAETFLWCLSIKLPKASTIFLLSNLKRISRMYREFKFSISEINHMSFYKTEYYSFQLIQLHLFFISYSFFLKVNKCMQ